MLGFFLNRGLLLIFGFAYPAYECYKSVEMNKPNIEQLRFWCQYWILVAFLTVFEKIGDIIIGWIPMYGEAKLALFVYLWYPKTKGTTYIYNSFFRPLIAKYETEIDHLISELRTRGGDMAVMYWQKSASYVQTRVFDIVQFIVSQSSPKQTAKQPQSQEATGIPKSQMSSTPGSTTQQDRPNPSPASSTDHRKGDNREEETGVSKDSTQALSEASYTSNSSKEQETRTDSAPTSVRDMLQEETGATGTRLRKVAAAAAAPSNHGEL